MGWLKTDYDFGHPYKVFTISLRQVMIACQIRDILKTFAEKPEEIEQAVTALIEFHRPDLKGGVLVGMSMGYAGGLLRLQYMHPSIKPRMKMGEIGQEEPLIGHPEGEVVRDGVWIRDDRPTVVNDNNG